MEDLTPTPSSLRAVQNQNWKMTEALSELIDNSFGDSRGDASYVHFTWYKQRNLLEVLDDGQGMNHVKDLFLLGKSVGFTPGAGDIGFYGYGGTKALLWAAETVTIHTIKDGRYQRGHITWEKLINQDSFLIDIGDTRWQLPVNAPKALRDVGHGTLIQIKIPDGKRRISEKSLKRYFSRIFSAGLIKGKKIIWQSGRQDPEELKPWSPPDLSDILRKEYTIDADGESFRFTLEAGYSSNVPQDHAKTHITYGHRTIEISRKGLRNYSGHDIIVWVDLMPEWKKTFSSEKTKIDNEALESKLEEAIEIALEPLIEDVKRINRSELLADLEWDLCNVVSSLFSPKKRTNGAGKTGYGGPKEDLGTKRPQPEEENGTGSGREEDKPKEPKKGDKKIEERAGTKIVIEQVNSDKLSNKICHVEFSFYEPIKVLINMDHDTIKMALEKKPVNKALLCMTVASHAATSLTRNPKVLEKIRLFTDDELAEICDKDDYTDHLIARMMDSLKANVN